MNTLQDISYCLQPFANAFLFMVAALLLVWSAKTSVDNANQSWMEEKPIASAGWMLCFICILFAIAGIILL